MEFNIWVIVICSPLLAFLIYQETKRKNRHWLVWRLVASVILVLCLTFMAIPITLSTKKQQKKGTLNLLTNGFIKDSLAAIKDHPYYTDPSLHRNLRQKATFIPDLAYYLLDHPDIKKIKIYGNGLGQDDLRKLKNLQLTFYPAEKPQGIVACNWNGRLKEEETLNVQGTYNNLLSTAIQLKLIGFGSSLDSIKIPAHSLEKFDLKHQVRQKGKALLQLVALHGKDTLAKETIPVQTFPKTPLNLLMLTSFPGFEYKFLKNWLYENQYPLALRSQISKNKYSIDFLNRKGMKLDQIRSTILEKEDVLLLDQQTLESLSSTEKQAITQAVTKGLGLVIWADHTTSADPLLKKFKLNQPLKEEKSLDLSLFNSQSKLSSLAINQAIYIGNLPDQQELINHKQQQIISAQQLYGRGKIIVTTLQSSYQWLLSGHQKDYASYWSELINAAARKQNPSLLFQTNNAFPSVAQQLTFTIEMPTAAIPTVKYDQKHLAVKQHLLFPNRWQAQSWPLSTGWNVLNIDRFNIDFFVFGKEDWKSINAIETIQNNIKYSKTNPTNTQNGQEISNTIKKELSIWWFLIAFILSAGFLWLENRIYAQN
ncbi:hypothetical protein [Pedobacter sp. ASV28]|uniref:hypothetical protein n=1 Tax=Pedobacter sp. ASV28 TaxID=2795123 RepID=UPI0018EB3114|nr:hypothetical protein [Pedobacter sp. ASV28]